MEYFHDFSAIYTRLEQSLVVAHLQVGNLFAHQAEIIQEVLFAHLVLAGNVGFAKCHQVVNIIAGIVQKSTHSAVGHFLVGNNNRPHVQLYEFLYIFHLGIHGQLHATEHRRNHSGSHDIMVTESPACQIVPSLAAWFTYVMKQGSPAQPEVRGLTANIFEHLHRMVIVVLMRATATCLHLVKFTKFGHDKLQKPCILEIIESTTGMRRKHNLVHLVGYALTADNLQSVGIARECLVGFVLYLKVELSGEAHTTHHAQRIIAEGNIWIKWCCHNSVFQVIDSIKGINQFTKALAVETHSQRIDGKVTTVLIVLECSILHNGLARIVIITLFTCTDKLDLYITILHLCSAKVAEYRQMSLPAQFLFKSRSHLYAASHHHNVNIIGRPFQEKVSHISAYHIAFQSQAVCCL